MTDEAQTQATPHSKQPTRHARIMRGIVTPIFGLLAVAAIVLGIINATLWKPNKEISASANVSGVRYIVTDPGVLPMLDENVNIRVATENASSPCIAVGAAKDVTGWLQGSAYVRVTGMDSWSSLSTVKVDAPNDDANQADTSNSDVAFKDSDMWDTAACGLAPTSLNSSNTAADSEAIIDLGKDAPNATVTLKWTREHTPNFAMPFFLAGGLLAVAAVLSASVFAMEPAKRRKHAAPAVSSASTSASDDDAADDTVAAIVDDTADSAAADDVEAEVVDADTEATDTVAEVNDAADEAAADAEGAVSDAETTVTDAAGEAAESVENTTAPVAEAAVESSDKAAKTEEVTIGAALAGTAAVAGSKISGLFSKLGLKGDKNRRRHAKRGASSRPVVSTETPDIVDPLSRNIVADQGGEDVESTSVISQDELQNYFARLAQEAQEKTDAAETTVADAVAESSDAVTSDVADDAADAVAETGDAVEQPVEETVESVEQPVEEAAEEPMEGLTDIAESAEDIAEDNGEAANETDVEPIADDVVEDSAETVDDPSEGFSEETEQATDEVAEAAEAVTEAPAEEPSEVEQFTEAVTEPEQTVEESTEEVAESVEQPVEETAEETSQVQDAIQKFLEGTEWPEAAEGLKGAASNAEQSVENAAETATETAEQAGDKVADVWHTVEGAAENVADDIKAAAEPLEGEIAEKAQETKGFMARLKKAWNGR